MGVVVGFALKVLRIIGLGPHVQLDGAVLVLGAQVGPVVPPDVLAVGAQLGLVVGVTIVEVVPQEGHFRGDHFGGGRFRILSSAQVLPDGQIAGLAGLGRGHAGEDGLLAGGVDGGHGLRKIDLIHPDHALVEGADMEGICHAGEAGGLQVDDQVLPAGGDDGMAAVSQDQVAEASGVELGVFGVPVHDELGLLTADLALHPDDQVLAPGDVLQGPHVHRFAPVGHPVGGVGVVVGFALKVLRIIGLGPHVQLDGAVLVLGAQVGPVVPPDVYAVGAKLGLVVGVTIVEVVPQEGIGCGGRRLLLRLGRLLRSGRFRRGSRFLLSRSGFAGRLRGRGFGLGRRGGLSAGSKTQDHADCKDQCE